MFRMRHCLGICSLVFTFCLASGILVSQELPPELQPSPNHPLAWNDYAMGDLYKDLNRPDKPLKYCVVASKVVSLAGDLIPGAEVQVRPALGESRVFKTDASGAFETVYSVKAEYARGFKVWVTVKKKGYQTANALIDYSDFPRPTRALITLRPENPDPALLSQQDLLADLLPRLKSLGPADGLSAKSQKKYSKGVREFVDNGRPGRALLDFSEVVRRDPECAKCLTMLALAQLDSGDWDGAAQRVDSAIALAAKHPAGASPEAMVLAGVMETWMHAPEPAVSFLARANQLQPNHLLTLQELGRAYLQLRQYGLASFYLEKAMAAGAHPQTQLLWVRALLGEDQFEKAEAEMERYRKGREVKSLPFEARKLWAEVQERKEVKVLYAKSELRKEEKRKAPPVDYLNDPSPTLRGLDPAKNQDELPLILAAVGKNVAALFRDFQNSTSVETIHQKQLRHDGKVSGEIDERLRYLFLLPDDPTAGGIAEYRQNVNPERRLPGGLDQGYMLTSGFASAALLFHPAQQPGSRFRYLGRQKLDGQETYVLAFAQIPEKAKLVGDFRSGERSAPILVQGLAWIDTRTYRILRLRTDLLRPLPELQLREVTTEIDYQQVRFKKLAEGLWLPKNVTVTVDWRGKTLRNEHLYSDFRLFNVHTSQALGKPKAPQELTGTLSPLP